MKKYMLIINLLLVIMTATQIYGGLLRKGKDASKKMAEATEVFKEFMEDTEEGIPTVLLEECHGIAIFPEVRKVGLGIGVRSGQGVMLTRGEDLKWGPPAFFTLRGVSTGWQLGAQSMDIVLLIMKKDILKNFVKRKVTMGADAAVTVGPKGRAADGNVLADMKSIYSYTRVNRGAFAGVAVKGSSIKFDSKKTKQFYKRKIPAEDLLLKRNVDPPEQSRELIKILNQYSKDTGEDSKKEEAGSDESKE